MHQITDINDPLIRNYLSLKKIGNEERFSDTKFFIAEGKKVVSRLLRSKLEIVSFFSTCEHFDTLSDLVCQRVPDDFIYITDKSVMNQIVGFKLHAGIMAVAKEPEETPFDEFGDSVLALNALADPENVGAIVRNAAAFGLNTLFLDSKSCSPYLRRAVRVSLGNIFNCRHRYSNDFLNDLLYLKNEFGYSLIAAEINDQSVSISKFNFPRKSIVIFGSEGYGVTPEILRICDSVVHIPINRECDSINVASSSAVFFHYLNIQHNES